jgi:hypothetical protein
MYASNTTRGLPVTANFPTPRFLRTFAISQQIHAHWAIYVMNVLITYTYSRLRNSPLCVIAEQCTQSAVTEHHIIHQNVDIYRDFKTR